MPTQRKSRFLRYWTDDERLEAARLRDRGLSYATIALRLGRNKNAISGMFYKWDRREK